MSTEAQSLGLPVKLVAGGVLLTWGIVWSVSLLGLCVAHKRFRHRPLPYPELSNPERDPKTVPAVTIIRPLRGLDTNLYYNLQSTLALDYPTDRFQVIFAIQDTEDSALAVVESLLDERVGGDPNGKRRWNHVDTRIIINPQSIGTNPKINNLVKAVDEAKYEILWVVDATISMNGSMLARSVEALTTKSHQLRSNHHTRITPQDTAHKSRMLSEHSAEYSGVGLVHHLPHAWVPNTTSQGTFGSKLEACYLNGVHGRMYLAINATGLESCVVGKSNMYRRSTINALRGPSDSKQFTTSLKGLPAFSPYLPEDNLIAHGIMHQLGLSHAITSDLAMDCLGPMTIGDYIARRVRWIRVRKNMVLAATLVEPLTESIFLGMATSWAVQKLFGVPSLRFFACHEFAWILMDILVVTALKGEGFAATDLVQWLYVWFCREALALPIWLKAMLGGNLVTWRGSTYKILKNGEALKL